MRTDCLVALGDSHLEALKFAADLDLLDVGTSFFSIVPGATAVGLRNPNSLTNAINTFEATLATVPKSAHVVIHMGEVDCGFVIWWRAQKKGESVEQQFDESIIAYRHFVDAIMEMGFFRICLAGASLPTIGDGVDMSEVANKRSEICVGSRERMALTLRYNERLKDLADELKLYYFDISEAVLDRSSGLVHEFFKNPDPTDHHLDKSKVVGLWAAKCNEFVNGCP